LILVNTDRNFGFALENAINEEKAQLRKTEDVQLKLSQLNAFLYTITFRETEEEFFSKLLELSIMLIPNGEKGSIWVKKGKFYSPIVGKGYDENLLKQLKLSETAAIDRWQNKWKGANTHIELNIASQGSLPEEIEISKVTSSEIKTTLFGAIKVDNKYYGGIFIDNTQSKNAFNEDDIEIMLGISKLASFYMTTKKLLEDLIGEQKRTLDVTNRLRALVDFSAHITPLESEEQFYKKLLNISLNIMPHAQKGSILIKEEGQSLMKYIAAEGYNLSQLNKLDIPFQLEESITESGNALVLKNITHKDVTISEKSKEILQSEELDKIKSTITAPTFIGDVYQGGIFLDNLDAEDIFDNEDLEVIKAVSNIASLYARTRYLLKESENRSILNKIAVEAFHEIDSAKSREEAIANTFYTFRKFFPKEIECISIIFKVANEFEYYYGDSTKVRYGTLTKLPECTKEINKSGFTEHIDRGCEALSFAPDSVKAIYVASPAKDSIFAYGFKDRELKEEEKRLLENLSFELSSALENFELVQLREETFVGTFIAFAKAIDSKDPYTRRHSEEVTVLSYLIGRQIGLGKEDLRVLFYASILHDIGKIGIPDAILQKPSSLTKEEYDLIKTHPVVGAEIAGSIEFLENAAKVLKYHHERYDGKGYPDKLSKEEIPFLSRIISVADSFSAITSERTYRPKRNYEEAVKILIEEKGKQFDPAVVDAFLSIDKELVKRELQSLELLRIYRNITS
jgi:putative nucleotidyltransferase with HDIG domain